MKEMKNLIALFQVVIFCILMTAFSTTNIYAGVRNVIAYPVKAGWHIVKWAADHPNISTCLFIYSQYEEATMDAVGFYHDRPTYGANFNKFHLYKTNMKVSLMSSMILKGMYMAKGRNESIFIMKRFIFGETPLAWSVWQLRKHHVMYNNTNEFRANYNRHLIYLPFPGTDNFIGLEGWKVGAVEYSAMGVGLFNIVGKNNIVNALKWMTEPKDK